jgi:hypothetical protein
MAILKLSITVDWPFIETGVQEHLQYIQLGQPIMSAVTEHKLNHENHIQIQDTKICSTKAPHMDWIIREATEIKLQTQHKQV